MPDNNKIDTKEEIELERAKIKLEKDKADLLKYKFDSYVGIVRDIVLILAILGGTTFNFMNGYVSKPTLVPSTSMSSGDIGISGAGLSNSETSVSLLPNLRLLDSNKPKSIINVRTAIWVVVGLAAVLLVIFRIKKGKK